MKNIIAFLILFACSFSLHSQEICDNAIDDDGDGLIDLNDDDCDCEGFGIEVTSLIPNPSFEEHTCCPSSYSQLYCADDWEQASDATADYLNTCGTFDGYWGGAPMMPLPGEPGGEGWAGFVVQGEGEYLEYIGSEDLESPLLAGVSYTVSLWTAWSSGSLELELSLFGTPNEEDMPWSGWSLCPEEIGSWELLASDVVTYSMDHSWQEITLTFTPLVDMNAVVIGPSCSPIGGDDYSYYYLDEFTLNTSFSEITDSGELCDGTRELSVSIDTVGGTWQWYKDGIALLGETAESIEVDTYGAGDYSAVYFLDGDCERSDYTVAELVDVTASFDFEPICFGETMDFTNTSVIGDGVTPGWVWNFGGDGSSTEENPSHEFTEAGAYVVELIILNDLGCNDTLAIDVMVDPFPEAYFEFVINEISSEDGLTGGCIENSVQFNDLSSIEDPGVITAWDWDFGDAGTSTDENPTHDYAVAGIYTVTLTVETVNGCESTHILDVYMTEGPSLDIIFNAPTCFGYTDGSITANTTGGTGEITFLITDTDDNLLNEFNSNTANLLAAGWYYITVEDETSCSASDSVFLDQPNEIVVDYEVTNENLGSDGEIDLTVTGDFPPFTFDWDIDGTEDFDDLEDLEDLEAGTYVIQVKDEEGCIATKTIIVGNLLGIETQSISALSVYPNPVHDQVIIDLKDDYLYQLITVNGDIVLEGTGTDQKLISLEKIAAGTYFLRIENEQGVEVIKLVKEP